MICIGRHSTETFYCGYFATGMAEQALLEVRRLLEAAPGLLDEKRSDAVRRWRNSRQLNIAEEHYNRHQPWRGRCQIIMPFEVWTLRIPKRPVGRFRPSCWMANKYTLMSTAKAAFCGSCSSTLEGLAVSDLTQFKSPHSAQSQEQLSTSSFRVRLMTKVDAAADFHADTSETTDTAPVAQTWYGPRHKCDTTLMLQVNAAWQLDSKVLGMLVSLSSWALQVSIRVSVSLDETSMPDVSRHCDVVS